MERLLYSNSIAFKLHHCHSRSPILPRLAHVDSPRRLPPSPSTPSFPLLARSESRRGNPRRPCNLHALRNFGAAELIDDSHTEEFSRFVDSANVSEQQKELNTGKVILISAILLASFHLAHVLPAFASKAGAPAAITAGSGLIRNELVSSAWAGFFAGCLHTLSGPDHLAALAPLSIGRTKVESAVVGALWGWGHDAGQMIFGLLFLLLKDRLQIEVFRTWGTRVVGLTLLIIGAMGIKEASEGPTPCVSVENVEPSDASRYEGVTSPSSTGRKKVGFATFATGIVHGLQPDALMMILPALALPSRLAGASFLVMFLVGTVISMASYTVFIGSCSEALKDRVPRITEKLTWASSLIAIGLGLTILVSQFFGLSLY